MAYAVVRGSTPYLHCRETAVVKKAIGTKKSRYMIKLGVNIDHIATIRQQRLGRYPDVLEAARVVKKSGAHGITIHLREDRRHIQEYDVWNVKKKVNIGLNLEMAATPWMVQFACTVKPQSVCLVPEKRRELTTEGGLDVYRMRHSLKPRVKSLQKAGIIVSMFINPVIKQVEASGSVGADCVELHTGSYASKRTKKELQLLRKAAEYAHKRGLTVNAGHGLDYDNVRPIISLPHMYELNIGFSIISRALFVGLEKAVKGMLQLLK